MKNQFKLLLIAVFLFMGSGLYSQSYQMVWSDEFDSIKGPDWRYDVFGSQSSSSLETYTKTNDFVKDGKLHIQARRELSGFFSTSRLITRGLKSWKYGRFEISASLPGFKGSYPAFWMLGVGGAWPNDGEIDVFEQVNTSSYIQANYIWTGVQMNAKGTTCQDSIQKFHTYSLEWTPSTLRFLLNGVVYHTGNISGNSTFQKEFYLILSMGIGGNLTGIFNQSLVDLQYDKPKDYIIDYVRVYQLDKPVEVIDAENYTSMFGIQTQPTTDVGGGLNVGYVDNGDWMVYSVNIIKSGYYTAKFRVTGWENTGRIALQDALNVNLTAANIPNNGYKAYQVWSTVSGENKFFLKAGIQNIRIYAEGKPWNFNWFELNFLENQILSTITLNPPTKNVLKDETIQFTVEGKDQFGKIMEITSPITWSADGGIISTTGLYNATQLPENGLPYTVTAQVESLSAKALVNVSDSKWIPIPGKIEAEDFCASSGAEISFITTGKAVGYLDPNDWLQYCLNVAKSGSYKVSFRVASSKTTGLASFQIKDGSTVLATVTVPNTGGWATYQTISTSIPLSQGLKTLTFYVVTGGFNLDWIDFALPMKIEAENYTTMKGVISEPTTDVGGGLNVGYTDATDYMEYMVYIPTTATYTVSFRVASNVNTGKFELRNQAGTVLATLIQGSTGGWQIWVTKSVTANLTAGAQTLRIYYTGAGLNLNWFEIVQAGLKSAQWSTDIASASEMQQQLFDVYPNPFSGEVSIKTSNNNNLIVKVYNMTGALVFSKTVNENTFDLSMLKNDVYILKASNKDNSFTKRIIKQ
jgi:beta-glucanase (GH16 family)